MNVERATGQAIAADGEVIVLPGDGQATSRLLGCRLGSLAKLPGGANIFSLATRGRVAQIVSRPLGEQLEPCDDFGMLGGDVLAFARVGLQVKERQFDLPLLVLGRRSALAAAAGKTAVGVRQVQLPAAAAHGL